MWLKDSFLNNNLYNIMQCADIFTEGYYGVSLNTISLERISPEVVFLRPPEKLVIEVKAKGRFREVEWSINGTLLNSYSQLASFSNYKEVLFIEETTEANFGLYEISLLPYSPFAQLLLPLELDIIVMSPGL